MISAETDTRQSDETDDYSILSGSGSADDPEACIRVGRDYQATIPPLLSSQTRKSLVHPATLLWIPCKSMLTETLEAYIRKAREQHRYSEEQALGMLLWHRHSLDGASADLANFTQRPDDWLVEEQAIFRQGLVLYSKRFGEIQQQLLRERRVRDLVEYYYTKYKLDRAHKLQLNQQKLFGTKTKRQQVATRRAVPPNGHAANSAWSGAQNGNGTTGMRGRNTREPQSPQVRNLLSFLSPTQAHSATAVGSSPSHGYQAMNNSASYNSDKHTSNQSASYSYFHFVPQSRRVNKPRGLQLELGEIREVIADRVNATHAELETLQQEYESSEQRLDEMRRAEQKPAVPRVGRPPTASLSDRFDESRKQLLARCNRDVHQVRDRMHFNDSVGLFGGRRTTQRWSQNELMLLQTVLNRSVCERGFSGTFRITECDADELLRSNHSASRGPEGDNSSTTTNQNQESIAVNARNDGDVSMSNVEDQLSDSPTKKFPNHSEDSTVDEHLVDANRPNDTTAHIHEQNCEKTLASASEQPSNGELATNGRTGNAGGSDKDAMPNHDKAAASRRVKYTPCDVVLSQLLDVLTSKNTAMIEACILEKMRLYDMSTSSSGAALRSVALPNSTELSASISGSPIVIVGDELSDDDANMKELITASVSSNVKRSLESACVQGNDDDVVLVDVVCAKKAKRD